MKKILLFILCTASSVEFCSAQNILTRIDSTQLSQANNWGWIAFNGSNISVTTNFNSTGHSQIYLRKLDTSLVQIGTITQLTFETDAVTANGVTDVGMLFLNGNHFVTFNVGQTALYLFKTDINGARIGNIVTVDQQSTNPTDIRNDMILTTDGSTLSDLIYHPVAPSFAQHTVFQLDQSLSSLGSVITSATLPHNNIGNALYRNSNFYLFTGDQFGFNASLILTRWTSAWGPVSGSRQSLIPTVGGDGNYMSTGVTYDSVNGRWYTAFHHNYSTDGTNTNLSHIDLVVFDNNFNLLERQHATPQSKYRPHLLLYNNILFMIYDAGGQGVFIHRYRVRLNAPSAPSLASPADAATNVSTTPTVSWNASTGATSYRLQVSTSSSFTTSVLDDSTITGLSRLVGPLANSTSYFWRVSAKNLAGSSSFSVARSFTTIIAAPATPTVLSPPDGATDISTTPTLSWNPSAGATSYRLQVATTNTFATTVFDDSTLTGIHDKSDRS